MVMQGPSPAEQIASRSAKSSSVCPSQSLSSPSHVSTNVISFSTKHSASPVSPSQTQTPICSQAPSPMEQAVSVSGNPSSVVPSQSLSSPSHRSSVPVIASISKNALELFISAFENSASLANALAIGTWRTETVGKVLIRFAIAVIIFAIAYFVRWQPRLAYAFGA